MLVHCPALGWDVRLWLTTTEDPVSLLWAKIEIGSMMWESSSVDPLPSSDQGGLVVVTLLAQKPKFRITTGAL